MKLLFTGGSGYIGSHTAYEFLSQTDAQITIIDDLSTGFVQNFQYLKHKFPSRIELIEANLNQLQLINQVMQEHHFDAVIHFAASLIVSESVKDPLKYYINNTLNTTNLIYLCIQNHIQKFLFSSTAAVYGEPASNPVNENAQTHPINPYGASKLMSEQVLRDASLAHDFTYVALRYFNVAGANAHNTPEELANSSGLGQRSLDATHLIKVASECAVGKRPKMAIYGQDYPTPDGTCIRDYIHINDLANAHLSAFEYLCSSQDSQIFNVGYNQGYSVKEVIETMKEVSGVDFEVEMGPAREGDPAQLISSNQKLLSYTNWKPKYNDLHLICKSAYEWEKSLGGK
ncbi:UDP-glucose 4-epimerase GalE [Helicobacter pametensis]|uniref:UDP-glucose 4-epimerase GalE n=1 Tax=Helicobacter pametensis TaxID=95149 RepID=UPI0004846752|nr:UDP-glucose 4-epimerase GalE [Helicobacter pametensis]